MSSMKVRKGEKLCAICKSAVILESRKNCSYCLDKIEEKNIIETRDQVEVNYFVKKAIKSTAYVDCAIVFKKMLPYKWYRQYFYVVMLFDGEYGFVESHEFSRYRAMLYFIDELRDVYDAKIDMWT